MGSYWHSLSFSESRQSGAVLPRRSIRILIRNEIVITDVTVITDEMIAIGAIVTMIAIEETIATMTGMGTTTRTKSRNSKATAMVFRRAQLTPSAAKASIHNDHTSGRTALTAITRVTGTGDSTNRSFVTHSCRAIVRVTNVMVATTDAVTMDAGEMADYPGPGK